MYKITYKDRCVLKSLNRKKTYRRRQGAQAQGLDRHARPFRGQQLGRHFLGSSERC